MKSGLTLLAVARGVFLLRPKCSTPTMKTDQGNMPANRREFLRGGVRYALLGGLATMASVLARKRGGGLSGQVCINQGLCRGCGAFTDCGLPQALSAKQAGMSFQSPAGRRGVQGAPARSHDSTPKRPENHPGAAV